MSNKNPVAKASTQKKEKGTVYPMDLAERWRLLILLPQEHDPVELIVIRDIKSKIYFTQKEISDFNIHDERYADGRVGVAWNKEGIDYVKDVVFTDLELTTLKNVFDKPTIKPHFPELLLPLYEIANGLKKTKEALPSSPMNKSSY